MKYCTKSKLKAMEKEYLLAKSTHIDHSNCKYRDLYKKLDFVKKVCGIWKTFEISNL